MGYRMDDWAIRFINWCINSFTVSGNFSFILLVTAILSGIGIAITGPLISGYIKKEFPKYSSTMIGVYSAGMGIGASLSAGLVVPAMHAFHQSWNAGFSHMVVFAFMGIIVWIPIIKKSKQSQESLEKSTGQKSRLPWGNRYVLAPYGHVRFTIWAFIIPLATWLAPKVRIWDIVTPTPQQRSLFFLSCK